MAGIVAGVRFMTIYKRAHDANMTLA